MPRGLKAPRFGALRPGLARPRIFRRQGDIHKNYGLAYHPENEGTVDHACGDMQDGRLGYGVLFAFFTEINLNLGIELGDVK